MTTTFSDYKFSSNGDIVEIVQDANFVRRTLITSPLSKLLKGERIVESKKDLKKTFILKLSKKETTFVLSVGTWGNYKGKDDDGKATYTDTTWETFIIGTRKFQDVKNGEAVNTVFYSF